MRKILVTGGSGLVGRALRSFLETAHSDPSDVWIFASSADADLRSFAETSELFQKHEPSHVIHLAVILMAGSDMRKRPADLLRDNIAIDSNVLRCAHIYKVEKVVSTLSSFAYPADAVQPITENQLHLGPCHILYESYGSAKRNLEILSRAYRQQYGSLFVTVIPSNIYGPITEPREHGPVIEGLIFKAIKSAKEGVDFVCLGTGLPERQFCYAPDLAEVLIWALNEYEDPEPLNIAGEEVGIGFIARLIAKNFKIEQKLKFDNSQPDGPLRRTISEAKLLKLNVGYSPTSFEKAMKTILADIRDFSP